MKTTLCNSNRCYALRYLIGIVGLMVIFALCNGMACAYTCQTCGGNCIKWNEGATTMFIDTTSMPPKSPRDFLLQNAMGHWNNVKGASFNFYVGRDTDGTHSSSNGTNEIYFDDSLEDDALAVTSKRSHCDWFFGWYYGIDEADIAFNAKYEWSVEPYSYSKPIGAPYSFEGVALHELGRALGLEYEDSWMATMNSYYPYSGPFGHDKEWDPFADDRQGIRHLYPDETTEKDIAASPLKSTDSGTSNLVSSPEFAERGSNVTIEFTFSNLGTSTESFDIAFYLSTDNDISSADDNTFLDTIYDAWGEPGFTGTFSHTLQIPSWIDPDTYYLGFIVDSNGDVTEDNETNNFQEMPISVEIF